MFHFSKFSSIIINLFKDYSNLKKNSNNTVAEKPFPRFRASVDEGLGLVTDGVYDYYCNICLQTILKHRHHFVQCQDYDLCESCLVNNIDECYKYTIKTSLHNEQLAEYQEINYLVDKIINAYYGNYLNILSDFNDFLSMCQLRQHQNFSQVAVKNWLKTFNSYTLNLFTQSKFYKKKAVSPFKNYNIIPSSSIY